MSTIARPAAPASMAPRGRDAARDELRAVVLLVCVAGLAWRTWAAAGGWFYIDDFLLVSAGREKGLGLDLLLTPNDSQLMPLGMLVAWLVGLGGPFAWWPVGLSIVVLQAAALASAWLMLRELFGERWLIVPPLVLLAFSPMAIDTSMWWAATLNGAPGQVAFFLLVTAMVRWSRDRRPRWALAVLLAFLLAAASGPRALLVAVPVGILVALLLTPGAPVRTLPWRVLRTHWPVVVPPAVAGIGYLLFYRTVAPPPLRADADAQHLEVLWNMLGGAVSPALLGGPWTYEVVAAPISRPDLPTAGRVVALVVALLLVVRVLARSGRQGRVALLLVGAQLVSTYLAIDFGRALQLGPEAALNTRYYPDVVAVLVLATALCTMPLTADPAPRPVPVRDALRSTRVRVVVGLLVAFAASSLVSIVQYTQPWHTDHPARQFVVNAGATLAHDPAPVADVEVPPAVQLRLHFPQNLPSRMLSPYGEVVDARTEGNDLRVLDDTGVTRPAVVEGTSSEPGPEPGCGWRVGNRPVRVPLLRDRMPRFPWTSLGYAASGVGEAEVSFDDREVFRVDVLQGPHTWFVNGDGAYSTVEVRTTTPGLVLCLDEVRAGEMRPTP